MNKDEMNIEDATVIEEEKLTEEEEQYSYDVVPYSSHPYAQSHPDQLATMARLFGVKAPAVTECRVLELGCAAGGNLIPMATQLPDSRIVGVDLSKKQIDDGQDLLGKLSLDNIELKHASILDVDKSWGEFDYILCHGVFSWVPEEVQKHILTIYSQNLSANGVGYISYNTYPGWHMRGMIRHMMNYHVAQFDKPEVRIRQARALLKFLSDSVPQQNNPHGMVLKRELDLLNRQADSYLFHEHLEDENRPMYFYQFAEWAGEHGLRYLSESDFGSMLARGFSEPTRQTLDRISSDMIRKEQYMDFLRNRPFRQTLLVHDDVEINRNVSAEQVALFRIAINAMPETENVKFTPDTKLNIRNRLGGSISINRPITKAAMLVLNDIRPKSLPFEDLLQKALDRMPENIRPNANQVPTARNNLASDMLQAFTSKMVQLCTWDPQCVTEVSDQPKLSPLAARQAEAGNRVVGPRHQYVALGPLAQKLAPVLDGTRNSDELTAHVRELIKNGDLTLNRPGGAAVTSSDEDLGQLVNQSLNNIARLGLLVA